MNEKISALMDGELDRDDAARLIKLIGGDHARRADWETYHLIGACMRGEAVNRSARIERSRDALFAALAAEPTVIAPGTLAARRVEKRTRMALAMAASIVTVSAVSVVALKQQSGSTVVPVQLVQQAPPAVLVDTGGQRVRAERRVNDYLVLHRQFANQSALQNASLVQPAVETSARGAQGR
jgi:sigma-E factor negative regulatory protein RseA